MTRDARPATMLTVMMIAAIYVVMLIGLTRSHYFVGGLAIERAARRTTMMVNQVMVPPDSDRPYCTAPAAQAETAQECIGGTPVPRRLLGLPSD